MLPWSTRPAPTFLATPATASSGQVNGLRATRVPHRREYRAGIGGAGPPCPVSFACSRSTMPCRRYWTLGSAPATRNGITATTLDRVLVIPRGTQGFHQHHASPISSSTVRADRA